MAFGSVRLIPGINVERTPTLLEAGFSASSLIRFRDGLAQKYGGWTKFFSVAVTGTPRELQAGQDLNNDPYLVIGTTQQLGFIQNGGLTDITPQQLTENPGAGGNDQYTKVLLHFDGTDASTTITDSNIGGSAHSWTANGNAQIDTAQFKFGGASGLFDGTGDYVSTPDSVDFTLGTSDFTIDFWFNCNAAGGSNQGLGGQNDSGGTGTNTAWRIYRTSGNVISFQTASGGGFDATLTGTTQFTNAVNTGWHHCAVTRSGSTFRLFLDGVQEASTVSSGAVDDSSLNLVVGRLGDQSIDWTGWIDEFRLSVGIARWSANFTPPVTAYGEVDFSTTSGSAEVTIVDTGISNVTTFDTIYLNTPVSVGGLILSGLYQITTIVGPTSYKITAPSNATSTVVSAGLVPLFAVTSGISTVTVTLANHGLSVNDEAVFSASTTVGGVTIDGSYTVVTVSSVDVFTIVADTQATSTTSGYMNGGAAQIVYYITLGPPALGSGYGTGGYGDGGYGTGTTSSAQTGTPITSTDWTADKWGRIVLATPEGGGVYQYDTQGGFTNAGLVATAPPFNGGSFVSTSQQILVCWASTAEANLGSQQDPMLVKWSDSGDYTNFVATTATQAGEFRIPIGSMIMGGMATPNQNLIWTDLDLWAMNYQGLPFVYGFNKIGAGAGLISSHAAQQLRGGVYWMGSSNFYSYTGRGVVVLDCPVWDFVFQNLNTGSDPTTGRPYSHNVRAMPNTPFNEVGWEFPSSSSSNGECDSYVKFNITEPGAPWDYGPAGVLPRSAWLDQSVLGTPLGASPTGVIYQHEQGQDADSSAMAPSFTTGYFFLAEGEEFAFVDQILPDMRWGYYGGSQTAQVQLTFNVVDYPGDTPQVFGPYTVTQSTEYISVRFRGRQMSITVSSSDFGSFWRLGRIRYRYSQAGRR
jgi:hypothetical protein